MIVNNLAVLLAERGLRITKVSQDTGISRTTLTSFAYNYSSGVQLDSLDKLCTYLHVTPSDILLFVPLEINFEVVASQTGSLKGNLIIWVNFGDYSKKYRIKLLGEYHIVEDPLIDFRAKYNFQISGEDSVTELQFLSSYLKLPTKFRSFLQNDLDDAVSHAVLGVTSPEEFEDIGAFPQTSLEEYFTKLADIL